MRSRDEIINDVMLVISAEGLFEHFFEHDWDDDTLVVTFTDEAEKEPLENLQSKLDEEGYETELTEGGGEEDEDKVGYTLTIRDEKVDVTGDVTLESRQPLWEGAEFKCPVCDSEFEIAVRLTGRGDIDQGEEPRSPVELASPERKEPQKEPRREPVRPVVREPEREVPEETPSEAPEEVGFESYEREFDRLVQEVITRGQEVNGE